MKEDHRDAPRLPFLQRKGDLVFFFNDTATTEIYTLSRHDALPISRATASLGRAMGAGKWHCPWHHSLLLRSEEHTSELQSQSNLVCRLLLGKKMDSRSLVQYYCRRLKQTCQWCAHWRLRQALMTTI